MKTIEKVEVKYVRLNTALIFGLIGLVVGFLIGNIYDVIQSGSKSTTASVPGAAQKAPTADQSGRIFALESEIGKTPNNQAALLELGNLYFDTDQPADAIRTYQKYLALNALNAMVWTDLGIMYREIGNSAEALASFDKALSLEPGLEQAWFNKGIVLYYDQGNKEAARKLWNDLSRKNPFFMTPSGKTIAEFLKTL